MSKNGVFATSRKLFDPEDPFFGGEPFSRREAWQWLIAEAAYKPRTVSVRVGRKVSSLQLDRGQLSHSRSFMRDAWGWSDKTVRTFLDRLEHDGRIARGEGQQTGQHQTVITICKYDEYQFGANTEGQQTGQQRASKVEKTGHETGQQTGQQTDDVTTDETTTIDVGENNEASEQANDKGQRSRKKGPELEEGLDKKRTLARKRAGVPDGFEEWYSAYDKKVSRKSAERGYAKVIGSGDISQADLLARTVRFSAYWARQPADRQRFKPYPASWLNDAGHFDERDPDGKPWVTAPTAAPPPDPASFSRDHWQRLLALHGRTGEWGRHWGGRPGEADCLVPPDLLTPSGLPIESRGSGSQPPNFSGAA